MIIHGEHKRGFKVIVADPPWEYRNSGTVKNGEFRGPAEVEYQTMSLEAIRRLPVMNVAGIDCVLYLWATLPNLTAALSVMTAWGFDYKSGFPWIKLADDPNIDLWGQLNLKPQFGIGFWIRGCSELVLIGTRGKPQLPDNPYIGLLSKNFGHSRKPDNIHEIAEQLPGPYLEMFARRQRDGWSVFGNQIAGLQAGRA